MFKLLIINMFNSNINLFGTLLSHDGWSGDTATGHSHGTTTGYQPRMELIKQDFDSAGNLKDIFANKFF
jgi:hypothetical protein